jgi:putative addiction module component (TIGR02574 family)
MTTSLSEVEKQARQLPLQERAELIDHLISSLDDLDEEECERLWLDEAKRRYQAYRAGTISSRASGEVFKDLRTKLEALR